VASSACSRFQFGFEIALGSAYRGCDTRIFDWLDRYLAG
jgi:hypothetical protein